MPKFGTEQEEVMREKTMKKGHLLLTLLAFVSLIWLGTIHADAATVTVNAKFKRFYGVAEEICRQLNQKRTSNGLNALKMDKNLTEEAMLHASQKEANADRINCNYADNTDVLEKQVGTISEVCGYPFYNEDSKVVKKFIKEIVDNSSVVNSFSTFDTIGIGVVALPETDSFHMGSFCIILGTNKDYVSYSYTGKTTFVLTKLQLDTAYKTLAFNGNGLKGLTSDNRYYIVKKGKNVSLSTGITIYNSKNQPVNFQSLNYGGEWNSSNPEIISINGDGQLVAKNYGISTIEVKNGSFTGKQKIVVADDIGYDADTMCPMPKWNSKSSIPADYTGNCYAGGYALEVKNGRITWSKNIKTNKVTRPGSKKSAVKTKKIKGNYYKVISKSKKTVQYVKPGKRNIISVTIPSSVKLNGKRYKVTGIAANAFKNCKKLKKVTIGINVNSIGKRAFYGCSKLRTIKVKTSKLNSSRVGKQAFKGIYKKAVIKVPKRQLKAYKNLFKIRGIGKKVKIKK